LSFKRLKSKNDHNDYWIQQKTYLQSKFLFVVH